MSSEVTDWERVRSRRIPLAIAWILCWFIWIVALTWLAFDGAIFLIVQAILAAFMSTVATSLSYWLGERIRPHISKTLCLLIDLTLLSGSTVLLGLGKQLGFAYTYIDPNSQERFVGLSKAAFVVGFFAFNFAVANLPILGTEPPPKLQAPR